MPIRLTRRPIKEISSSRAVTKDSSADQSVVAASLLLESMLSHFARIIYLSNHPLAVRPFVVL